MISSIRLRPHETIFLIHPGDDADGSLRLQAQFPKEICRLHRHSHTRTVIDRARSQIPGIEVSRNDNDLLGMFATLDVPDHVKAFDIGKLLWGQGDAHFHRSLPNE